MALELVEVVRQAVWVLALMQAVWVLAQMQVVSVEVLVQNCPHCFAP